MDVRRPPSHTPVPLGRRALSSHRAVPQTAAPRRGDPRAFRPCTVSLRGMPNSPSASARRVARATAAAALALVAAASPGRADTVVLTSGKKIENVVVSKDDSSGVVLNPFNSRCPDMTWGITDKDRIPRDKVKEVVIEEPPLFEARLRAADPAMSIDARKELIEFCRTHKLDDEAKRHTRLLLAQELAAQADESGATPALPPAAKGDPEVDPELRRLEREYLALTDGPALDAQWKMMQERATTRPRVVLERARRSARQPKGRREKVPLTVRAKEAPGGNYCIYVPAKYDPLVPTPLVVALHGGGPGGKDGKLVTGNGEEAMNFYADLAERWGWVVVCPSALVAQWGSRENEPLVDATIEEMKLLFHVDESRIYLTGHSMGGFGTWHWGPHRPELWAAIAPCAGGGGPNGVGELELPTYIYHGSDDEIVGASGDRAAAQQLMNPEKPKGKRRFDGVYTEIGGVGHGFPEWVRNDIFRWFAGHRNDRGKRRGAEPVSSFARKVEKEEVRCFGDPSAAPAAGDDTGDAKLADLVAKLQQGGGAAIEAAAELAKRRDAPTAKAVGRVLRNKKANSDVRVAAARCLGEIGGPDALAALAAEVANEDYRIVDEATSALARIGGAQTLEPLLRAAKQMGAFYESAFAGGQIGFTEYEVRCRSFGRLADALAATGQAEPAIAALEKEVVVRVYTPKTPYQVPIGDRFVHIPPRARLELVQRLRAAFGALKAPRGKVLLEAIRTAWTKEPALVAECDAAIAAY